MKGWKTIFHGSENKQKAGVATLISEKIDFKTKTVTRNKENHYIILNGSTQPEDITLYNPNKKAHKNIKKFFVDFKGDINSSTVIVGNFNIPLLRVDKSSKQKINKSQ